MKKHLALAGVGLVLTTSLACQPLVAQATPMGLPSVSVESELTSLSAADWNEIAMRASAAGDAEGVSVARAMATRVERGAPASSEHRNIWSALGKKALLEVLRYGINKLPAKIRPYVNKIIGVVEDLERFQQAAVVTALVHAGVPADVAAATAHWIVVFLGL